MGVDAEVVLLIHTNMRRMGAGEMRLRSRSNNSHRWRRWCRSRHCVWIERVHAILEGLQRHELGKLATQDLGMTTKMMSEYLGSLLIFSEVTALIKATGSG